MSRWSCRRLTARRGRKKAVVAVGHTILVIAYHVIAYHLLRLGDWWRLQYSKRAGDDPADWVWVVAWWGEDFEPFGPRLRGARYTWAAQAGSALGGDHNEELLRAFPPPVWHDLPDYAPAG